MDLWMTQGFDPGRSAGYLKICGRPTPDETDASGGCDGAVGEGARRVGGGGGGNEERDVCNLLTQNSRIHTHPHA